jgi:hypothetical protein
MDDVQRDRSPAEWCAHRRISKPTYHKLKNQGLGPDELIIPPNIIRITHEADQRWEARMRERAEGKSAQLEAARRVELAHRAAAAAVASPKHPSRIKKRSSRRA